MSSIHSFLLSLILKIITGNTIFSHAVLCTCQFIKSRLSGIEHCSISSKLEQSSDHYQHFTTNEHTEKHTLPSGV